MQQYGLRECHSGTKNESIKVEITVILSTTLITLKYSWLGAQSGSLPMIICWKKVYIIIIIINYYDLLWIIPEKWMFITALSDKGHLGTPEQEKYIEGKAECNITCYRARKKAIKHEHIKWSPIIHKSEIHKHYNPIIIGTVITYFTAISYLNDNFPKNQIPLLLSNNPL